ncbi:unnamed protein product [Hymenolepis diminuta]|uniref:Integrase catalytic domain-containing protein n=1 Tax=Hymenolepis diminuta TaxID=6216 RepID=A0A564YPL1_HYMDI|nr:unnamed protein product [Hymenolepis diminuta]
MQPTEIGLTEPISHFKEKVSKVVAKNVGETVISCHRDLVCTQTKTPWSHIDLSFAGLIQRTSYLILVDSNSKWPEIMTIKSATIGTIINSLRQLFANQGVPIVFVSRNVIQFSSTRFEDFFHGPNVSLLHSSLNINCLDEKLVDNVKR